MMRGRRKAAAGATLALGVALAAAPGAPAASPLVEQMVVASNGTAHVQNVRARKTIVKVGRRKCAVGPGLPLSALLRSAVRKISLKDYGQCSRRTRDGSGLYVRAIGRDKARGNDGWVYKVDHRHAVAGAADPAGPFGRGRLKSGARVAWYYCRTDDESGRCAPTLEVNPRVDPDGSVAVEVRAYDDEARASTAGGATVRAGAVTATTGPDGMARLSLPPGTHSLHAEAPGTIRSFPERVVVP
jgi:hypothetical protein